MLEVVFVGVKLLSVKWLSVETCQTITFRDSGIITAANNIARIGLLQQLIT